jgi:hypothetical protein
MKHMIESKKMKHMTQLAVSSSIGTAVVALLMGTLQAGAAAGEGYDNRCEHDNNATNYNCSTLIATWDSTLSCKYRAGCNYQCYNKTGPITETVSTGTAVLSNPVGGGHLVGQDWVWDSPPAPTTPCSTVPALVQEHYPDYNHATWAVTTVSWSPPVPSTVQGATCWEYQLM